MPGTRKISFEPTCLPVYCSLQRTELSRRIKAHVMSTPTMHLRGASTCIAPMHVPAIFASQVPTAAATTQAAFDSVANRMSHPARLAMRVPCMSDAATHGAQHSHSTARTVLVGLLGGACTLPATEREAGTLAKHHALTFAMCFWRVQKPCASQVELEAGSRSKAFEALLCHDGMLHLVTAGSGANGIASKHSAFRCSSLAPPCLRVGPNSKEVCSRQSNSRSTVPNCTAVQCCTQTPRDCCAGRMIPAVWSLQQWSCAICQYALKPLCFCTA